MTDIDRVVRALVATLDGPPYSAEMKWPSPILSVLDCILSLDRRKPGDVEERLKALQNSDPSYGTLVGIRDYAGLLTPEIYFRVDPRDEGKRAGLLLPLLDGLIDELRDFPGDTEAEQARAWANAARPSDWAFGPYRGLGLRGFQRLRQLLGANTLVPTKEIVAWVARAVGRELEATEAVHLLERAAGRLRYSLPGISEDLRKPGAGPKGDEEQAHD